MRFGRYFSENRYNAFLHDFCSHYLQTKFQKFAHFSIQKLCQAVYLKIYFVYQKLRKSLKSLENLNVIS